MDYDQFDFTPRRSAQNDHSRDAMSKKRDNRKPGAARSLGRRRKRESRRRRKTGRAHVGCKRIGKLTSPIESARRAAAAARDRALQAAAGPRGGPTLGQP